MSGRVKRFSVASDGGRRPRHDGWRRVRRAVPALAVGCALVACAQAQAVGTRTTTVAISCGAAVVVSEPATCTATVKDTAAGTPSTPTGPVNFTSDSEGAFTPASTCTMSPGSGTEQSNSCSVEYDPTKVGPGTQKITGAYAGDSTHAESSGSGTLEVGTRSTALTLSCGSAVVVSQPATCTATVTDTNTEGTPSPPRGEVSFASDAGEAGFGSGRTCTPNPLTTPDASGCSVKYTPGSAGSRTIMATYAGDELHGAASASATLVVTAAPTPAPTGGSTTTSLPSLPAASVPPPAVSPAAPKCRVRAEERWKTVGATKPRRRKLQVPEILVRYTCDQDATVRIGGAISIAAARHGRTLTKAVAIKLATVSSRAAPGTAEPGVVLALAASAAKAVSAGIRTTATVRFTVKNANGIGVGTIKFLLLPPMRATHGHG